MLDAETTINLIRLAKNGDESAKSTLIEENSPLVKSVIKKYLNKGIEFDDLYQLGSLGFLKAINNFDESFNVKFSSYAVPMIAGEIKRFIRDNGIIKVSRSTKQLNIKINRFIEKYISENQKSPQIDIIAKEFEMTEAEIVYAMDSSIRPMSLYTMVGDDSGKEQYLIDKVENEKSIDKEMDNELLYNIIKDLPQRERKIIILRYFRDKTQKDIASELGVSQVQVSRLENKILQKLKEKLI
ncbi:MAG: SigB/SigF/SigG family RNA polymerase sigma factor [Clostridiales bacterium]|nr:SigB/SigF/SigG family RNA polymerase sigma factor [Clostridiales bacterium]